MLSEFEKENTYKSHFTRHTFKYKRKSKNFLH